MSHHLKQLLDRGVTLKRQGDLEGARDCYIQALKEDPTEMMIYINLGKVAHLLKSQDLAIRSYLAAAHLQVSPVEIAIEQNSLPIHLKIHYDNFPKAILDQLPRKSGFIIFIDSNTPRHAAHSLIDLSSEAMRNNPQLTTFAEVYNAHIFGNGQHEEVLLKHGISINDQISSDEENYIPLGREFFIDKLKWESLHRNDVLNLYF
ncbi:hypothetical protein [Paenibacillus sp. 453mf]|uniref:hypothetical protein n=1 Tax=Paenibacillus sp. 453mf TaxID=1761874 RepID=UPI0008E8ED19|nr:hypothetical protein [Paenibacillus sp. 453mf]SFT00757.1 hypothetical protein SAMN04488601_1208 [Paenibacillus sp. 453mf]